MATIVTRYVNTTAHTSGDGTTNGTGNGGTNSYNGIRAALTAEYANYPNLVTSDIVLKFICEGSTADSNSGGYTMPSFTTDSTRYLWIYVDPANRHAGKYTTNKYRITDDSGSVLAGNSTTTHYLFEGVQIVNTSSTSYGRQFYQSTAPSGWQLTLDQCVIHTTGTASPPGGMGQIETSGATNKKFRFYNTVFSGRTDWNLFMTYITAGTTHIYNCTFVGGQGGIIFDYSAPTAMYFKNNIIQRYSGSGGSAFSWISANWGTGAHSNNITDDTTSPDASYRSLTATYVNAGTYDYHLASNDTVALGQGVDLSADSVHPFSVDIDGDTRSGAWSIGADQGQTSGITRTDISLSILA